MEFLLAGMLPRLPYVCLPVYQRKHSAESFRSYVRGVISILQNRMDQAAAASFASRTEVENERGESASVEETEGLLSAVLSAHLVLCRVAILYPWKKPFYSGAKTHFREETRRLASALVDAWELLGVGGKTRKQLLRRLFVVVGQRTLEARQKINELHHRRLQHRLGTAGDVRGSAALQETEGENCAACREPSRTRLVASHGPAQSLHSRLAVDFHDVYCTIPRRPFHE